MVERVVLARTLVLLAVMPTAAGTGVQPSPATATAASTPAMIVTPPV
jgi:hypothetical protein